ncbi:MAG: hypothetical protein OQL08_08895 [Gammaproteobacteria bacterium]|nr:hypothetical protein [Gammaproteobacteria bacterium]
MSGKKYHAITEFLDAKQRRVKQNTQIPAGRYDEATIAHYLSLKMIAEGDPRKPHGPQEKKPIGPDERKSLIESEMLGMLAEDTEKDQADSWTEDGAPEVGALNRRLKERGIKVSAKERDAIWADLGGIEE